MHRFYIQYCNMAPPTRQAPTRQEREQFFADLERLDNLSEDESDLKQTPPSNARPQSAPSQAHHPAEQPSRKRKISSPVPHLRPRPRSSPPPTDLPRPSTSDAAIPSPKVVTPPAVRRTQSERAAPAPKGKKGKQKAELSVPQEERIFEGLSFFFIPNKDDYPVRRKRIQLAVAHGATWVRSWEGPVTHVIIDKDLHIDRASRELPDKKLPDGIPVVRDEWLVESLRYKDVRDPKGTRFFVPGMSSPFELKAPAEPIQPPAPAKVKQPPAPTEERSSSLPQEQRMTAITPEQNEQQQQREPLNSFHDDLDKAIQEMQEMSDIPDSILEDNDSDSSESTPSFSSVDSHDGDPPHHPMTGFICMEKHDGSNDSPNARTVDALQRLSKHYDRIHDQWRTRAFRMAASALRKQTTLIRTKEEAINIKGIGPSIARQIEEYVTFNGSRRLDAAETDSDNQLLSLFLGVYGAGRSGARRWIAQWHRTLDDLRNKADLTPNQKVGLEHYEDFKQRIPRVEVEQHAAFVRKALQSVDKGLELIVGGSYRRGNPDSGDIDLLIMKKGAGKAHLHTLMADTVIPLLTKQGFLVAELATGHSRVEASKWHGASVLPGSSVWRRLDLLFVPWEEQGAALIYFTGNDIFNRSIRYLAGKKGMRLNQHGLFKNVLRGPQGTKLTEGELVEGNSERKIFELLGVTYRPPEHRRC